MLIRKSKNVMSAGAELFINKYAGEYKTHKIFIELAVTDFIAFKTKQTKKELPAMLQKRASRLTFDFYDHTMDIIYEINGNQHYSFNSFFHEDIGSFDRQQSNDFTKTAICEFYNTEIKFINAEKELKR